jgi:metallophosphoesterase (TIGR00282 family)
MRVLFVGDVIGKPGRKALRSRLRALSLEAEFDLVIVNGENAAGGFGITRKVAEELFSDGASVITSGNHVWDKKEALALLEAENRVIRPANYPPGVPGSGSIVVNTATGARAGVLNLAGRVFMQPLDCPFRTAERELGALRDRADIIIVDMHAEATSEKIAMGWHLDGKVAAVLGTHTHVQTADERILPGGTAYITDIGMTGPINSVIGVRTEQILDRFMLQMPNRFEVAPGPVVFSAVEMSIDETSGLTTTIRRHYEIL